MSIQPPVIEYCWIFLHPIAEWCGGTPDDTWTEDKKTVEQNARHCEWPTKIISREKKGKQKQALTGSVRPSIRGQSS